MTFVRFGEFYGRQPEPSGSQEPWAALNRSRLRTGAHEDDAVGAESPGVGIPVAAALGVQRITLQHEPGIDTLVGEAERCPVLGVEIEYLGETALVPRSARRL
jgi:hypothetical protein